MDKHAALVVRHPLAVLLTTGVVAVLLVAGLHRLRADLSPERLVAGEGEHAAADAVLARELGGAEGSALALVRADDVLTLPNLQYVHAVSRRFARVAGVVRVDGPTVTPLPHETGGAEETLEELERTLGGPVDDRNARLQDAVGRLVASSPRRFPAGMHSLASGDGPATVGPVVSGARVTPGERQALEDVWAGSELVRGRLLSADRRVAAIAVTVAEGADPSTVVRDLRAVLDEVPSPAKAEAVLTGLAPLRAAVADGILQDQLRLVPLGILVNLLILLVCFRWLPGVLFPLAAAGAATGMVVGGIAWLDIPLDLGTNVVPALLITLGVADAIHVVTRYREERAGGLTSATATLRSTRRMVAACFLTSLTTAVGFGSLIVAQTDTLRRLGWVAAIGVLVVFVVVMTSLPAMLALWPGRRAPSLGRTAGAIERMTAAIVDAAVRRPVLFAGSTLLVVMMAVPFALRVPMDGALLDPFDPQAPVRRGAAWAETHLDGVRRLEIVFRSREQGGMARPEAVAAVDRVASWAGRWPEVLGTTGPGDYLRDAWKRVTGDARSPGEPFDSAEQVAALRDLLRVGQGRGLDRHLSPDGRHARLTVSLEDVGIVRTERFLDALDAELAAATGRVPGVGAMVGGEVVASTRGMRSLVRDLTSSLGLAVIAIFAAVALLFRSARLSLLAAVPNLLPLVVTLAWMGARGIPLGPGTAIVFTVALGLAVDGTIHVLARFREELAGGASPVQAVRLAGRRSGGAVVIASLTLIAGFLILLTSDFVPVRQLGELAAVSLLACLVADLVLLPGLLAWAAPALQRTWQSGKERPCPSPGPSGVSCSGPPGISPSAASTPRVSMPS